MTIQEKPMPSSFKPPDQKFPAFINPKQFSLKIDKILFNKNLLREEFSDVKFRRLMGKKHQDRVICEFKSRVRTNNPEIPKFARLELKEDQALFVVRTDVKIIRIKFYSFELKASNTNTFASPTSIHPQILFGKKAFEPEKANIITFHLSEKELGNLKNVFYYKTTVPIGQTPKEKEKLENARRLIDPNEPNTRKKIEEKFEKLKKVKVETIKKQMMNTVPFPRFLSNASEKSSRRNGGAFLKKLQQRVPNGHPIKTKVFIFKITCISKIIFLYKINNKILDIHIII